MTSSTMEARRAEPLWVKSGIAAVFVLAACWGGAIWYWRTSDSTPATSDLVLGLLALPSGLLFAIWLGKKAIPSRGVMAATATASPVAAQADTATPCIPPLALLATALRVPHGSSVEELAAVVATNKAQPDLDQELVDDQGFPLTCARRDDANDGALEEEILEWQTQNNVPKFLFGDAQYRALVLGTAVMRDLAWHAMSDLCSTEGGAPQLRLIPILPADWTAEQHSAAQMWLKHIATQAGLPSKDVICLEGTIGSDASALTAKMLDRFAVDTSTSDTRLAAIVIACGSNIDQATVDQWAQQGKLFTPFRPQGFVPGEGAAGFLLTDLRQAQSIEGAVYALLDPVMEAKREPSRGGNRADPGFLDELAARVVKSASIDMAGIGVVVGDASHRGQNMQELMGFTSAAMPQLDSATDVASVGPGCGNCGAVPFVTALALARHYALERGKPVLYMSNDDPEFGHAALVRPAASAS